MLTPGLCTQFEAFFCKSFVNVTSLQYIRIKLISFVRLLIKSFLVLQCLDNHNWMPPYYFTLKYMADAPKYGVYDILLHLRRQPWLIIVLSYLANYSPLFLLYNAVISYIYVLPSLPVSILFENYICCWFQTLRKFNNVLIVTNYSWGLKYIWKKGLTCIKWFRVTLWCKKTPRSSWVYPLYWWPN